jgi:hypothetical protein
MSTAGLGTSACLVLVDYDNALPPSAGLSDEEVVHEVERWLRVVADLYPSVERFEVRLYGGWYDDADLSRRGSEVARLLPLMPRCAYQTDGSSGAPSSWPLRRLGRPSPHLC